MAGGALAQALPLLLGPLLTRLYSPQQFGLYHLFAAVAANLAVVACARYEHRAAAGRATTPRRRPLVALCRRILLAVIGLCALVGRCLGRASASSCGRCGCRRRCGAFGAAVAGHACRRCVRSASPRWPPAACCSTAAAPRCRPRPVRGRCRAVGADRRADRRGAGRRRLAAAAPGAGLRSCRAAALAAVARRHRDFPLLNTPHAFLGALQDTLAVALIAAWQGPAAAGFWGLALRYLKAPATLVGGAVSQALYPALAAGGVASEDGRAAVRRVLRTLAAAGVAAGAGAVAVRACRPLLRPSASPGARPANWRARWRCTSACISWPRRWRW